ncbi:MAG: hypothetical protein IJV45_01575 [Prevotella sp.]|nr:hypothetical protein [Prevotella sp.]
MMKRYTRIANALLASLIAALGFGACTKIVDTPDLYGPPPSFEQPDSLSNADEPNG